MKHPSVITGTLVVVTGPPGLALVYLICINDKYSCKSTGVKGGFAAPATVGAGYPGSIPGTSTIALLECDKREDHIMGKRYETVAAYELPAHWVSFIINGDTTGMTEFEVMAATEELDDIFDAGHVLVDVIGEPFFDRQPAWGRWSGSDKVVAGMVCEYVAAPHWVDGEVPETY